MADKWYAIYHDSGDAQFTEPRYTLDDFEILSCERVLDPGTPVPGGNVTEITETQYDIWFDSVQAAEQKYFLVTDPVLPLQDIIEVDWTFDLSDTRKSVIGELQAAWGISVGTWIGSTVTRGTAWVMGALEIELARFNDVGDSGAPFALIDAHIGSTDGANRAAVVVTLNAEKVTRDANAATNEGEYVTLRDLINAAADFAALEVLRLTIPTAFTKNTAITSTIK